MSEYDYKDDVNINPDELDIEWLKQATLYAKYSKLAPDANDRVRRLEQKVKVIRSQLILEASEKGEEILGKGVKPTGQPIEAYYRTHEKHIEAKKELFEAMTEAEMINNALFALQQKKTALENLTRLVLSGYFSTPTVPRELGERWKEVLENGKNNRQEDVSDRMLSRRRRRSGDSE